MNQSRHEKAFRITGPFLGNPPDFYHKGGQYYGTLMFLTWTSGWTDVQLNADLKLHEGHVMPLLWKQDDVIRWKHFPRYWPFVRGIHQSPVNSPHKCKCRRALMISLICAKINSWVNNQDAGDLRRHHVYYDVTVMEGRLICSYSAHEL